MIGNQQSQVINIEDLCDLGISKNSQPYIDNIFKKEEGTIVFPKRPTRKSRFTNSLEPQI